MMAWFDIFVPALVNPSAVELTLSKMKITRYFILVITFKRAISTLHRLIIQRYGCRLIELTFT
ncbi:hypothetical protein PDY_37200 [Photobacterium damselae subsp. damselae]|nr:hypothetical protein PDY_37200 [Photobacterium damselae subsp. damselae]